MSRAPERKTDRPGGSVARWDPFADLDALGQWSALQDLAPPSGRLARLLESAFGESARPPRGLSPAVDIHEDAKQYTITVELPGTRKEDVSVELHDGVLTIRGEKRSEREEKKEKRRWVERSYGSFTRSFSLPGDADAEHIDAGFKDGVLTLAVRRTEQSKPRTVAIR